MMYSCTKKQLSNWNRLHTYHSISIPCTALHAASCKVIILTHGASVSGCRLCSGLRDGTETSSTLRRWSSARSCRHYRLNSCDVRAFSVLGPRLWNSLPRLLCDTNHKTTSYGHSLKTVFSQSRPTVHTAYSALAGFGDYALYRSTF